VLGGGREGGREGEVSDSARDDSMRNKTYTPSLPPSLRPYLQRDQVHPIKGVTGIVRLGAAQGQQQTVGAELDVIAHEAAVEGGREGGREGGEGELTDYSVNL